MSHIIGYDAASNPEWAFQQVRETMGAAAYEHKLRQAGVVTGPVAVSAVAETAPSVEEVAAAADAMPVPVPEGVGPLVTRPMVTTAFNR